MCSQPKGERWGQKVFIDRLALFAQPMDSASQIDGVPQHDGGNDQIQPAGSVALILKASIAQLAQAVEEDRTRQGVLRFAFVQPQLHPLAEFRALKPLQREQGPFQATQLPQGESSLIVAPTHAECWAIVDAVRANREEKTRFGL